MSFDVPDGQLFCLLGPNGAGKTTTVSILTTTLMPTAGRVRIAERDLATEQALVRRDLGIVFQQPSLDLNLTAEENIRLHAVLYGLYPWRPSYRMMPGAYRRQVQDLAGVLGLADVLGRRTRILSGGMRRKLEIVRALMHQPLVLFLDEPTAGLDPESRRSLWTYLQQIRRQYGTTVFLTTHYLEEAEAADSLCVLSRGRIIERGSPSDVKARYTRAELVLGTVDGAALRRELLTLGLQVNGTAPLRVPLDGRSAQSIIRALESELTRFQIVQPTLEDTYLRMLKAQNIEPTRLACRPGAGPVHELWAMLVIAQRDVIKCGTAPGWR
ncbi:MAG: ATP-binding cassette domain-containing protein [Pseudonocardiaceae bacterium]